MVSSGAVTSRLRGGARQELREQQREPSMQGSLGTSRFLQQQAWHISDASSGRTSGGWLQRDRGGELDKSREAWCPRSCQQ